jgi:hypothetical protein
MTQAHPVPDMDAGDRLPVENMTAGPVGLVGSDQRDNQIQLRAGIDHPSDAAKNAIHFSKCTKAIDVNRLQARGLRKQFRVVHETPRQRVRDHQNMEMSERRQKCEMQPAESFARKVDAHQTAAVLT